MQIMRTCCLGKSWRMDLQRAAYDSANLRVHDRSTDSQHWLLVTGGIKFNRGKYFF